MASGRADPQRPPLGSRGDCAPHGHWELLHAASPPKPAASAGTASLERKTPDPTLVGLKTNQLTFWTHQRMWVPRVGGSGEEPQKSGKRARMIFLVGNVAQRSVEIRPGGSGPAYRSDPPSPTDNDACEQAASLPIPHLLCWEGGPGRGAFTGNLKPKWRQRYTLF